MAEFALHGFAGAKLTDVAKRAGISHGTIYNYFDSKEALFRALFRARLVEALDAAPLADALAGSSVAEVFRSALRIAFRQLAGSDAVALVRILLVEGERFPDLVRECRNEIFSKAEFTLNLLIEHGLARSELVAGSYQRHTLVLFAPIVFYALFGPLSGSADWVDEAELAIDAFAETIMRGMSA